MTEEALAGEPAGRPVTAAPGQGLAAWPRQRVRVRTRPLGLRADLGQIDERWQAECGDCTFTASASGKPEVELAVREHVRASSHRTAAVCAIFVVSHGARRGGAVSRLTMTIMARTA